VLSHVVNRYRLYNSDAEHSKIFSTPILRDVWACLSEGLKPASPLPLPRADNSSGPATGTASSLLAERPPVAIFSCHDTTVLAVLYLMKQIGFDTGPDAFYDDGVLTDPRPPLSSRQASDAISWPGFGIIMSFPSV
jgi:hypothetical protein